MSEGRYVCHDSLELSGGKVQINILAENDADLIRAKTWLEKVIRGAPTMRGYEGSEKHRVAKVEKVVSPEMPTPPPDRVVVEGGGLL